MFIRLIKAICDFCFGHAYYQGQNLEDAEIYFKGWDYIFDKGHVFCSKACQKNYQKTWEENS